MAVEITLQDRTLVAVLDGEIDHHCAQPMRTEIDEKITAYQPEVLVLDLQALHLWTAPASDSLWDGTAPWNPSAAK